MRFKNLFHILKKTLCGCYNDGFVITAKRIVCSLVSESNERYNYKVQAKCYVMLMFN